MEVKKLTFGTMLHIPTADFQELRLKYLKIAEVAFRDKKPSAEKLMWLADKLLHQAFSGKNAIFYYAFFDVIADYNSPAGKRIHAARIAQMREIQDARISEDTWTECYVYDPLHISISHDQYLPFPHRRHHKLGTA